MKVKGSAELPIPVSVKKADSAVLRVGFFRKGGISKPITITLNGKESHTVDLSYGKGTPQFFDYVELDIDPANLKMENYADGCNGRGWDYGFCSTY